MPRLRLLHCPLAGGVRGDAAEVHAAGAVLDENQDVQPLQQHSVHVQEVDGEDPGGLGVQELPPGRACASRRRACQPLAFTVSDVPALTADDA
jgi:hypothetical protein